MSGPSAQAAFFKTTDDWRRLGVDVDPVVVPPQRDQDREYSTTFPAFRIIGAPTDWDALEGWDSKHNALPENGFRVTGNQSRYTNAQFDGLINQFFRTIAPGERLQTYRQIVQHISDQVTALGLYYRPEPTLINNRLVNVAAKNQMWTEAWNAHEWDVR